MIWRLALAAFLTLCLFAVGQAPAQFNGCSAGFCSKGTTSAPPFQGPGDIVASPHVYWGLICITTAYTGNVTDVVDAATGNTTGTRLKCSAGGTLTSLVSGSACTFVTGNACSSLATTCSVACKILTFYDQSGTTNCNGNPCDITQATLANQATLTQSCNGSTVCATFGASTSYATSSLYTANQAQPYSISTLYKRTTTTGTQIMVYFAAGNVQLAGNGSGAGYITAAGTNLAYTATDNAYHSVMGIYTATCTAYTDGSVSATPAACGTNALGSFNNAGLSLAGNQWIGTFYYASTWASALNSTQASSLSANDHTNCGC